MKQSIWIIVGIIIVGVLIWQLPKLGLFGIYPEFPPVDIINYNWKGIEWEAYSYVGEINKYYTDGIRYFEMKLDTNDIMQLKIREGGAGGNCHYWSGRLATKSINLNIKPETFKSLTITAESIVEGPGEQKETEANFFLIDDLGNIQTLIIFDKRCCDNVYKSIDLKMTSLGSNKWLVQNSYSSPSGLVSPIEVTLVPGRTYNIIAIVGFGTLYCPYGKDASQSSMIKITNIDLQTSGVICNTQADTNCDNKVSFQELNLYANKWVQGQVTFQQLIQAANAWVGS